MDPLVALFKVSLYSSDHYPYLSVPAEWKVRSDVGMWGESPPRPGLFRLDELVRLAGLVMCDGERGWVEEEVEERGLCIAPVDGDVMPSGTW